MGHQLVAALLCIRYLARSGIHLVTAATAHRHKTRAGSLKQSGLHFSFCFKLGEAIPVLFY